jgi:hypothetical protein
MSEWPHVMVLNYRKTLTIINNFNTKKSSRMKINQGILIKQTIKLKTNN